MMHIFLELSGKLEFGCWNHILKISRPCAWAHRKLTCTFESAPGAIRRLQGREGECRGCHSANQNARKQRMERMPSICRRNCSFIETAVTFLFLSRFISKRMFSKHDYPSDSPVLKAGSFSSCSRGICTKSHAMVENSLSRCGDQRTAPTSRWRCSVDECQLNNQSFHLKLNNQTCFKVCGAMESKEAEGASNPAQHCCGQGRRRRRTTTALTTFRSPRNCFDQNLAIKCVLKWPVQWCQKEVKRAANSAHCCHGQSSRNGTTRQLQRQSLKHATVSIETQWSNAF